jgi:hypothetical protein
MGADRDNRGDSAELARQVLRAVDLRGPSESVAAQLERRALVLARGSVAGLVRVLGRVVRG